MLCVGVLYQYISIYLNNVIHVIGNAMYNIVCAEKATTTVYAVKENYSMTSQPGCIANERGRRR